MGVLDVDDPLYEAFRRYDQYGKLGWAKQPWPERLRMAFWATFIVPLKFFGCLYFVVSFYLVCRLSFLIPAEERGFWVERTGCICARLCCLCVGIFHIKWVEVRPNGKQDQIYTGIWNEEDRPPVGAVISNHCSYLDILVLLARYFPSFVARSNTRNMPFIGLCSQHLQCIFVDRDFKKGPGEVKGAGAQVKERMQKVAAGEGLRPVLLFPEGTTTNGKLLLPFKTGAFLAGVPVQPCIVKWKTGRVSPSWDSIDAFWHVFLVLANPVHHVTVFQLPIYTPSEEEQRDPHLYSEHVRNMLMDAGGFGSSEANLMDCRAYINLLQGRRPPSRSRAGEAWAEKYGQAGHEKKKSR